MIVVQCIFMELPEKNEEMLIVLQLLILWTLLRIESIESYRNIIWKSLSYSSRRSSCCRNQHVCFGIESRSETKFDFTINSRDISPNSDGGIIKRIVRRGNGSLGYPQVGDLVLVDWVIYDEDENIIHDFSELEETFHFTLGARYQVIPAFEIAVKTMYEGEVAILKVSPEYGFGNHSEQPFKSNQTLYIEFTLEELIVGVRHFETVSPDFDIKEELYRKIDSGEINLDDIPVMEETSTDSSVTESSLGNKIPDNAKIPAVPMPFASSSTDVLKSETALPPSSDDRSNRRFYNAEKDKLDPNRTLRGIGNGHAWDESIEQIVVEVAIPDDLKKSDIMVEMRYLTHFPPQLT